MGARDMRKQQKQERKQAASLFTRFGKSRISFLPQPFYPPLPTRLEYPTSSPIQWSWRRRFKIARYFHFLGVPIVKKGQEQKLLNTSTRRPQTTIQLIRQRRREPTTSSPRRWVHSLEADVLRNPPSLSRLKQFEGHSTTRLKERIDLFIQSRKQSIAHSTQR